MTALAHLSSGYTTYEILMRFTAQESGLVLGAAIAGAIIPDIDAFFGAAMKDHRNTVFHGPLFWLSVCTAAFIVGQATFPAIKLHLLAFLAGALVHLFLDWFSGRTSGVRIFYPFSRKNFSLFPLRPERGTVPTIPGKDSFKEWVAFWRFYFSQRFLVIVELLVIASP